MSARAAQPRPSVLAVDDSATVRDELSEQLSTQGYEVLTAASGEEAILLLGERHVDCIVLDMVMPGISGEEACRRIKASPTLRTIPIVMLTSRDGKRPIVDALRAGADDFVTKSEDLDVLEARLRAQLRMRRFEEEHRRMREELLEARMAATRTQAERELSATRARLLCDLEAKNEELARARDRAELGVRARDEFLSIASHELRTPLTPLKLHLQNMRAALAARGDVDGSRRMLAAIEVAARQTERLALLVDALLDASRISAGSLDLRLERLDLLALVREVVERVAGGSAAPSPRVTVRGEGVVGSWDRLRCEQVATNLVTNALRYGRGEPVEIDVRRDGAVARVTVRDRGIGIDAEQRARIFGIFERAASSRHYGGLGLGLYITRRIVEAHGGTIDVESAPGVGSTFTVELPVEPRVK
jgi:signal transduction histidine kinase